MKSTGIVRKVDELGRIVLPIEMRRTLDIGERDALEIYVEGSSVILKKYKPSCIFCDATKDITVFKGKNVCPKCLKELKEQYHIKELLVRFYSNLLVVLKLLWVTVVLKISKTCKTKLNLLELLQVVLKNHIHMIY